MIEAGGSGCTELAHRRTFTGPPELSLLGALEHEPAETTRIQYLETLHAELTELQTRLLMRTCEHYTRHYTWTPSEDLRGTAKSSVQSSEVAPYALALRGGRLSVTESGRMLYRYLADDPEDFLEAWKRAHPDEAHDIL